jgi:Ca2+-binding RTX toxin-like protein
MMRRPLLLLATTALALIAAGGIALAATFTCTTNPCDGTADDDVITGTVSAETINGKAGNDELYARDANDTLNGEDGNDSLHGELGDDQMNGGDGPDHLLGENGTDRLNGGAGNDTLDGGPETENDSSTWDYYHFNPNWGNDTIIDGRGLGLISAEATTAAAMPNLTVNLVSDPTRPEVTDGNGNTMNWENNDVRSAVTGAGDDVISQRPKVSNGMNGGAGNDTYQGYTNDPPGEDNISDPSGTADVLDLSSYNVPPKDSWKIWKNMSTGNVQTVQLWIGGAPSLCWEEVCRDVFLNNYFDNTSTEVCASKPGPGLIETIKFADDPSVDFAQVRSLLGCPPLETTITSMTMEPWEASTKTTFRFSSNDGEATFECKLDDGTFHVCTSPKEFPGLIEGSTHTFELRAVDPAGNPDPIPARRTWTVDTTPPMVNSTNPVDDATGIAPTTMAAAFFSEDMDQRTLTSSTFTLTKQGSSTPVSATVSYFPTIKRVLLDPSSDLEANTTYTATVKGGAKDLAGNALAQDYTWTFTTAAPAPNCTKTGTANAETLSGTSGADVICAGGGNDTVKGLGGNDILKGQGGNDKLLGGAGDDTLDGEIGTDTASYSASLTAVNASLATNSSTGEGSDTFVGVENLLGSPKADTLTGSGANNTLTGGGGGDTEHGGAGNDKVVGSGGSDYLYGEDGADTVNSKDGVNGNDALDGGIGTDTKTTDATEKSIVGFP